MRLWTRRSAIVLVVATTLAACGDSPSIPFDTVPETSAIPEAIDTTSPSVTTAPPSTAPPAEIDEVGREWSVAIGNLAGMPSECGSLNLLAAWPGRDALVAGIALHGLWVSTDGGEEWTQLGTGESSAEIIHRPTSIVFDPDDPNRFWESGLYRSGAVYRTDDGGEHFTQLGDVAYGTTVAVDLSDPQRRTLLLGLVGTGEVYRSVNGGENWVDITSDLPRDVGEIQAPVVLDRQTYLVGSSDAPGAGIFRTIDGGRSWRRVHDSAVAGVPVVLDGTIYWLLSGGEGLVSSTDDGETWTIGDGGGISFNSRSLVAMPDGRLATMGDRRVVLSSDGGESWRPVGPGFPFDFLPTGLVYSPEREAFFIWRNDCARFGDNSVGFDAIQMLPFTSGAGGAEPDESQL